MEKPRRALGRGIDSTGDGRGDHEWPGERIRTQ